MKYTIISYLKILKIVISLEHMKSRHRWGRKVGELTNLVCPLNWNKGCSEG